MKEKRCWICRRSKDEVDKDFKEFLDAGGFPDDASLVEIDLWGDQKVWLCQGCNSIIYKLTHHDENFDDQDIVLFEDLRNLDIEVNIK